MHKAGARGIPHAFVIDTTNTITFSGHPRDPGFESAVRKAAESASPRVSKQPLPLITESYEELLTKSIKELKTILTDRGVSTAGAVEKGDLAKLVVEQCSKTVYYK